MEPRDLLRPQLLYGGGGVARKLSLKGLRMNISGSPATRSVPPLFPSADEAAWKRDCSKETSQEQAAGRQATEGPLL